MVVDKYHRILFNILRFISNQLCQTLAFINTPGIKVFGMPSLINILLLRQILSPFEIWLWLRSVFADTTPLSNYLGFAGLKNTENKKIDLNKCQPCIKSSLIFLVLLFSYYHEVCRTDYFCLQISLLQQNGWDNTIWTRSYS